MDNMTPRDLSALHFHARVLEEAAREANPLLERANFLAIVSAGMEEFQRVRLPRLKGSLAARAQERLDGIASRLDELYGQVIRLLAEKHICVMEADRLTEADLLWLRQTFVKTILPGLKETPAEELPGSVTLLAVKPVHGSLRFYTAASLPGLLRLPGDGAVRLIPLETAVRLHVTALMEDAEDAAAFRLLRDEHFTADEGAENIGAATEACMIQRRHGRVMRVMTGPDMDAALADRLGHALGVKAGEIHRDTHIFHPGGVMRALADLSGQNELHYLPHGYVADAPLMADDLFAAIREKDRLLIHPENSLAPVICLVEMAARDAETQAICMTLYRIKTGSALAAALITAAENGKQVTVLVETRARFDEENNLGLARRLMEAGCRVLSGPAGWKVHGKALLITRNEGGSIRRYTHLGTGNYHEGTARQYTDFGLLTADDEIGRDAENFFAYLTGNSDSPDMTALTASPWGLRAELIRMLRREMAHAKAGRPCGVEAKVNALTDKTLIAALYAASRAGVSVDLTVRGACGLQPGIPGLSENITVRSVVGRYLEHGRLVRFINGGRAETYISSADWMKRSLDRRVELLTPIRDQAAAAVLEHWLRRQQQDDDHAWYLHVADYTAARCCDTKHDEEA